jgi:hypothetical protein
MTTHKGWCETVYPTLVRAAASLLLIATPLSIVRAADTHRTMRESIGVNIHFTDPEPGAMDELEASGLGWVRMDLSWGATEQHKGVYDFSHYDTLLSNLDRRKMRALLILDYGNDVYGAAGKPPYDDDGRAAFARWAVAAVDHFKRRGVLWELWNEPNGDWFWPRHNADDYAKLALVVDGAIRGRFPHEMLIGPATSIIDLPFLTECFKQGCLTCWDAVSVHPYRQGDPETVAAEYAKLRELIDQYAPPGKRIPIISSEWGYSVAWDGFSDMRQAKYVTREMLVNIEEAIPVSIWYDWHDDGGDPKNAENRFGLVRMDAHPGRTPVYDPKPAYIALQTMTSIVGDFSFDRKLTVGDPAGDHVDRYVRRRQTRIVAWTTSAAPKPVTIPLDAGVYEIVDWQGNRQPVVVETSGLSITLTDMPQYVVPSSR